MMAVSGKPLTGVCDPATVRSRPYLDASRRHMKLGLLIVRLRRRNV